MVKEDRAAQEILAWQHNIVVQEVQQGPEVGDGLRN